VAPHKYWLTNDNALAAYTLSQLGVNNLSTSVTASLRRFGHDSNGLIEAVWGVPVSFPPYVERQAILSKIGDDEVWQEFHDSGPRIEDWSEYSNLGFLGALNEYNWGNAANALSVFYGTLAQFDGTGFRDKAFNGQYETYKLALALYAGARIHATFPNADQMLSTLQALQGANGGFRTHYRDLDTPEGDTNTETTALALLALGVYGCAPAH